MLSPYSLVQAMGCLSLSLEAQVDLGLGTSPHPSPSPSGEGVNDIDCEDDFLVHARNDEAIIQK